MDSFDFRPGWDIAEVIAEELGLDLEVVARTIDMLGAEKTIPFIARYRKEQTKDMDVDKLRDIERLLQELNDVQAKAKKIATMVHAKGALTPDILADLQLATTVSEIELVFSPFKPAKKKSLAERAKLIPGLSTLAEKLSKGIPFDPHDHVNVHVEGKKDVKTLLAGIGHIIADQVNNNKEMGGYLKEIAKDPQTRLDVTPSKVRQDSKAQPTADAEKYQVYFSRRFFHLGDIQDFHVLAINRAEKENVMTVKVEFTDRSLRTFKNHFHDRYVPRNVPPLVFQIWEDICKDTMERLMIPRLTREIRSNLTKKAVEGSLGIFGDNLKHLLMAPPVSGKIIMGIDPGFTHGCKLAIIDETSAVLQTAIVKLHQRTATSQKITRFLTTYRCQIIAIGNGTACRETEVLITDLLKQPELKMLDCSFCIVNECGSSIYSVSQVAIDEMPDLDPCLRSAVSIARRLQNPMAELVKIEPKHLGIGQYQHDLPKGPMEKKLDSVVQDCVSFVGVDINSCSPELLRFVAGVGPSMAERIIKHRARQGNFICRKQLLEVKGLGAKTYEQCAGFIRVNASDFASKNGPLGDIPSCSTKAGDIASTSNATTIKIEDETDEDDVKILCIKRKRGTKLTKTKKAKKQKTFVANPLDTTWIHPEAYDSTERLLCMVGLSTAELGTPEMKKEVDQLVTSLGSEGIAQKIGVDIHSLEIITKGLTRPNFDLRSKYSGAVFKKGVLSLDQLRVGTTLTGQINNVVEFGAFVDIGVGSNGLIHSSKMRGITVNQGNKVEVAVLSIGQPKGKKCRIGLGLKRVL